MAKNKEHAPENHDDDDLNVKAKSTKSGAANQKINALILPWLVLFLVCAIAELCVSLWLEYDFSTKTNNHISDSYKQLFIDNTNAIISNQFAATQKQLNNIATDANIKAALLANDLTQINTLSLLLQGSFNNSVSLQIIPWDITGTVGLKERNIEPRNNIEMVLLSRAGSKNEAPPEVYQYNKEWIASFASPVIQDDAVIGIILLSLNKNYLADMFNTPAITDIANISISSKSQEKEIILNIGNGTIPAASKLPTPFADGELAIAFNAEKLQGVTVLYKPVHIAIAISIGLMLVMCCIGLLISIRYIKKDIHTMINFIDSLSALHKTKQPDLMIGTFSELLNSIISLSERTTKTSITTEVNENYKSPQAMKPPEKPGLATVAEKNQFEYPEIFRDYDIRGLADSQLNTDSAVVIGKAIGSEAMAAGISTIISGRDGRTTSERIQYDITRGILSTGCNVINIGMVPSPVLYYATEKFETGTGVMITGSHNPAEYNGVKIVINHKSLHGHDLQKLLKRIEDYDFATGEGKMTKQEIIEDYIQAVSSDIIIAKPIHVVVDAGNGVGGQISTQLLGMLDCQVTPLYCDVDGTFPNHGPDPSLRANLTDLINKVQELQADLGIAFDGDADRMVAVTATGQVINGDQLLMLFAKDIVSRNAASNIIYDVKCSANVEKIVSQYGGRALISKSGHSNMKAKMQETSALLGGEFTGHFFFKERWYGFDDGIYAAMRLIELITTNNSTLDEEIGNLPTSCNTPEMYITLMEPERAAEIIDKMQAALLLNDTCKIDHTDGIRADFGNGWGLIRMSNTSPKLTMRFEAQNEDDLEKIQHLFKSALVGLNMNLSIPF